MSHRILRYETDDGERWAVWSTVVEDWIWYDFREEELIEWYLGKQARKASDHIRERIDELRDGENPYHLWNPEEKRDQLPDDAGDIND